MFRRHCLSKGLSALFTLRFARPIGTAADTSSPPDVFPRSRTPQLRRLAVVRPDLVDEWVPEMNDIDVSSVQLNSLHSVWWRCGACGKNYEATVRDRAVSDKGCPHCHRAGVNPTASASENANNTNNARSLAETHPQIASRWDTERNGLLLPSDVTSESDLCVWWLPAPGRASDAPFRLPVCAFVEMPFSREEQLEASAVMESDTLQQIRQAARIPEARMSGSFTKEAYVLDDFVASGAAARRYPPCDLIGEDMHRAIDLWECESHATSGKAFAATETTMDASAVVRAQGLEAYVRFVEAHHKSKAEREGKPYASDGAQLPSAVTDVDWAQHFALTAEDVAGDRIAETAKLVLFSPPTTEAQRAPGQLQSDSTQAAPAQTQAARVPHRMDSLPVPPEEYSGEIFTAFPARSTYPRRPPPPPEREDDIVEGVPRDPAAPGNSVKESATPVKSRAAVSQTAPRARGRAFPPPPEAAFDSLSLSAAHSLTEEYARTAEANMPFDAEEKDTRLQSLLGATATQSMPEDQVRALQYGRTAPRPRRTGKFRLRMPADAFGGKTSELAAALGTDKEKSEEITIEAPGMPRKVARPKKKRVSEEAV